MRRHVRGIGWWVLLLTTLPGISHATRQIENNPRIALYTLEVGLMSPAQLDTLSWYDKVLLAERPSLVSAIRGRNPDIDLTFVWMPQNIVDWSEDDTFWYPDTSWSLIRLAQFYAQKNDWYLRDVSGNRIPEWGGYAANWTRYCPLGTWGSSKDKTYVEWLTEVAMPQMTQGQKSWQTWGPGSTAYNGLMLEILADCVGSYGWQTYQYADPDRDGIAEGVYASCSGGGWDDSLSVLYREQNELFHDRLSTALPADLPVYLNGGNKWISPAWWTDVTGMKLESWMSWPNPAWQDWWDWFYGLKDMSGTVEWGPGYEWCERNLEHDGSSDEGWESTLLQVYTRSTWSPETKARMKRFGLGTTLLGGGYFMYTKDQKSLLWQAEYEWDFGNPRGAFTKETYGGQSLGDTLYVREFDRGFVEVNPNAVATNGVAPSDSRFGFWQSVTDLAAEAVGESSARVSFTMPGASTTPVGSCELRLSTVPIDEENWDGATPYAENPIVLPPGTSVEVIVTGLDPGAVVHFRLRNRVYGRLEPGGSNGAALDLPGAGGGGGSDESPPAAIGNLSLLLLESRRVQLTWTAPGDDGADGQATRYHLRRHLGGDISSEAEWSAATIVSGLPAPKSGGSSESYWASGLEPGTVYGFALRAEDEAGNLGGLSNPLVANTEEESPPPPPAPDTTAPSAIDDLARSAGGPDWIELRFTATGDDGESGRATRFLVRFQANEAITSEADWTAARAAPGTPPAPGTGGTVHTFRVTGLAADTMYGFAIRAEDEAGNRSALAPGFTARSDAPVPAPDEVAPGAVTLEVVGSGDSWIQLRWVAPGDDGAEGRATRYLLRSLLGRGITTESQWTSALSPPDPAPTPLDAGASQTFRWNGLAPNTLYGFALRAEDEADNRAVLSAPLTGRTAPPPNVPPSAVFDLAAASVDTTSAHLTWTSPHDGEEHRIAAYEFGLLEGRGFTNAGDWDAAIQLPGPDPTGPGTAAGHTMDSLRPGTLYGVALRARDAEGATGPLSNFALFETDPRPASLLPPDPISDLTGWITEQREVKLRWTAPRHPRAERRLVAYQLHRRRHPPPDGLADRTSRDAPIRLLAGEEDSTLLENPPPRAAGEQETLSVALLEPETTYSFRLTAIDDEGMRSPAGNTVQLDTPPLDDPPDPMPDEQAPAAIDALLALGIAPRHLTLRWTAVGDDGTEGEAAHYVLGVRVGERIDDEDDWSRADTLRYPILEVLPAGEVLSLSVGQLAPSTGYGFTLRARDEAGNLSALGASLYIETTALPDSLPPERIVDLELLARSDMSLTFRWSAPADSTEATAVARYHLRFREGAPIESGSEWDAAVEVTGSLPTPGAPGSQEHFVWSGLTPDRAFGLALRAEDEQGFLGPLSPVLIASTSEAPPLPFDDPPGTITDLRLLERTASGALLTWTATGEDSARGRAVSYEIRFLAGDTMPLESDWDRAAALTNPPAPNEAGTREELLLPLDDPHHPYAVLVRARDGAGQLSSFVPGVSIPALPDEDPEPTPDPLPIQELRVESIGPRAAWIRFPHPERVSAGDPISEYEFRIAGSPIDLETWPLAVVIPNVPPPGDPGVEAEVALTDLSEESDYWIAARVVDSGGRRSPLSPVVTLRTDGEDSAPPTPPSEIRVRSEGAGSVRLDWQPSSDARTIGYRVYYGSLSSEWIALTEVPIAETSYVVSDFDPRLMRRFALSTVIAGGGESALAPANAPMTGAFAIEGPFPHPIREGCRLRISLPVDAPEGRVEVYLLRLDGRRIRELYRGEPYPGSTFEVRWDRRDGAGHEVGPGYYFVIVNGPRVRERRTIYVAP